MLSPTAVLSILALLAVHSASACEPVRFAYLDQHRPPYWLGSGEAVAEPAGASVELVQQFAASVQCPLALTRLPVMRIRPTLAAGIVDFAPMDGSAFGTPGIAFPLDKQGRPDVHRAVQIAIVLYVRAADAAGAQADPMRRFRGKTIGTTMGASYRDKMEQAGMQVDAGGKDVATNLEKLRLHRIDGFAVSVVARNDMDAYVAAHYGKTIVRIEQPLWLEPIWLAASASYYQAHPAQVDAMWSWLGSKGTAALAVLVKKYSDLE